MQIILICAIAGYAPASVSTVPGRLVAFVCAHGGLQRPGILMSIAGMVISGSALRLVQAGENVGSGYPRVA